MADSIRFTETNKTLTNANTEYSVTMTKPILGFTMQARTGVDVRFAFTADKVASPTAPYFTLKANTSFEWTNPDPAQNAPVVYLASGAAGTVVEFLEWGATS